MAFGYSGYARDTAVARMMVEEHRGTLLQRPCRALGPDAPSQRCAAPRTGGVGKVKPHPALVF